MRADTRTATHTRPCYISYFSTVPPPGCDRWFTRPGLENTSGTIRSVNPLKPVMLFDVEADPEERDEVSDQHPNVVDNLLRRLGHYLRRSQPITFPDDDPRCDPGTGAWGPWE